MKTEDQWLHHYGKSHSDITYAPVYWLSTLAVIISVVGILWSLPVPEEFRRISPLVNWGSLFLMTALIYYFIISLPLALGLLPFVLAVTAAYLLLQKAEFPFRGFALLLLIIGVAGIVMCRLVNNKLVTVARDLQLMMIAPPWLLSRLYSKWDIPY